ncbi:REP element-mobilizing transposase RayT [Desulfacinum hydrothermale DSM 13146]|uniref:REP element-mobilizing transposase RayT n=1 Tax=Desulfacinum hydrothermale DSM 13146 TaxID=1121390 RepID=A0A1W1XPG3_9BACT|nr:transposase [Desulfacinum hydrothermale]SMC25408.1 REP element-mobilizing transposase RayT [Desulfacinum hydrothermale DSM 13146]
MRQGQAGKAGAYFVTIVTQDRACLFGHIVDGEMRLNAYGKIVRAEWFKTAQVRPYVVLHEDEFVVMPNHIHGIIWIVDDVGARRRRAPTVEQFGKPVPGSIPTIIRAFKSAVTQRINGLQGTSGGVVWQRNYYEHIIRDEESLNSRGTAAPCPY